MAGRQVPSAAQVGAATGAGQGAGSRDLVATGRTVEPEFAIAALLFVQALLLATFGALTVHFSLAQVIGE